MNILELIPGISGVIEKIIPDPNKQQELKLEMAKLDAQDTAARMGVLNSIMGHKSIFVAGGIPALIWLAVIYILANHIIYPLLGAFGLHITPITMPGEYWSLLNVVIVGLFGKKVFDGNTIKFGSFESPSKDIVKAEAIAKAVKVPPPTIETVDKMPPAQSCDYDDPADVDRRLREIAAEKGIK